MLSCKHGNFNQFFPTGLFNFFFLPEKVVGTGDGCAEVVQMISVDVSDTTLHFLPEIVLTKGITMNKNMCLKFILKHYQFILLKK